LSLSLTRIGVTPNGLALSRERRGVPPRFVFDDVAPLVGFRVVLVLSCHVIERNDFFP
jgi:hypothetical protein